MAEQPERLNAERLAEMSKAAKTYGNTRPPVGTGDYRHVVSRLGSMLGAAIAEVSALRSTIAQLEAERDQFASDLSDLHAEALELRYKHVALGARCAKAERQVAADAPKLQAAQRVAAARRHMKSEARSVTGYSARNVEAARLAVLHAADELAALFSDPEHTSLSEVWRNSANDETAKPRRTVDMAGRPVGELATRTLVSDEQDAATEWPDAVRLVRPIGGYQPGNWPHAVMAWTNGDPWINNSGGGRIRLARSEWELFGPPDSEETP